MPSTVARSLTAALALIALAAPAPAAERIVKEGIAIDLAVAPLSGAGAVTEGEMAKVTLTVTDTLTGTPLGGRFPAAWLDRLAPSGASLAIDGGDGGPTDCKQKVEAFVSGGLMSRPSVDLNAYYVLALNEDETLSVVDPLFGYGNSKLLDMVFLKGPGEDWALSRTGDRLFVSVPGARSVAVVSTGDWNVESEIPTASAPHRLLLQPDGHFLWVATEDGVAVIDAAKAEKVSEIQTGGGRKDLAASADSRFVFVTSETEGTVAVVDVATLGVLRRVPVGAKPSSVAWSTQAGAAYVVTPGAVVVVDPAGDAPRSRIAVGPAAERIRFSPDGRLGFVIHPTAAEVHLLDVAVGRVVQIADTEEEPHEVGFSDEIAYIRHRGSETVLMVPLKTVGEAGKPVPVIDFPGGQRKPGALALTTPADGLVRAPGANAVLVANPEDKTIYYYKEGMAAPMGHFKNYGRKPRAVLVLDRSLGEVRPGVYETVAKMGSGGDYDLALYLDSPRLYHCFPVKVAVNPALAAAKKPVLEVEMLSAQTTIPVGEETEIRFRLRSADGSPKTGVADATVLTFLSPGLWQRRQLATEIEAGLYRVTFRPPETGLYFVFLGVESEGLPLQKSPYLALTATPNPEPSGR